jgi:hypothetical protein
VTGDPKLVACLGNFFPTLHCALANGALKRGHVYCIVFVCAFTNYTLSH